MSDFGKILEASQVFTPGAPVQTRDLFAGRREQLGRTVETLSAPGRHPVIFGQRGVGKTSLANVLGDALQDLLAVKVSCDGSDTFSTIWNRVLYTASLSFKQKAFGFSNEEAVRSVSLVDLLGHDPSNAKPAEIGGLLSKINKFVVIIFDEFDKVVDPKAKSAFADLIKILSYNTPRVTLIRVGVSQNVHDLIGEHPSIDRNLVHIDMPTMSDDEISTIVDVGFSKLRIKAENGVVKQIPALANGYPHYAHLLGLSAAKACITNSTATLTHEIFEMGCRFAVSDATEKYRDMYARATMTTQPSRYPIILCACGYANCDARGVFRATDVVEAVKDVFNLDLTVQAVVPGLGEFLSPNSRSRPRGDAGGQSEVLPVHRSDDATVSAIKGTGCAHQVGVNSSRGRCQI